MDIKVELSTDRSEIDTNIVLIADKSNDLA